MIRLLLYLYNRAFQSSPWLAYAFAVTVGLTVFSRLSSHVNFFTRQIIYIAILVVACVSGICSSFLLVPLGRRVAINYVVARSFKHLARVFLGVRTEIIGAENFPNMDQPCVYVLNHQSSLDLIALGAFMPANGVITAKRSLKFYPFLGQFMMLANNIFINRGNRSEAIKVFKDAVDTIHAKKLSVVIFPEGTRGRQVQAMLPFKKGAFHMAVQAGIPVVPVVFSNFHSFYCKKEFRFESGLIKIKVLNPIPTKNLTTDDVEKLAIDTREVMVEALEEISDDSKKHD
ncbi:1-acylglycerol-3-phosphate O-acyltransferase [Tieghemiomyces parasiticus]|uniref:1-acyl-sn-glycerol-3-phosphate acyltransferase n=1 Tax=Tieghemiomyces parasiticus TaxID=78921 RepID=A0A9W8A9B1_9FUNG|nr:1-acylglycerol-3-phosphate O-acyltransferase [Tieghemiomyces parasiticus]